jgi:ribosomal protein S18 acetylase RimI-like enzyme
VPMADVDALSVGRLYRDAIPQALFARLGDRFTARFVRWIHEQEHSQVWVAKKADGATLGVIAGTLDRPGIYRKIVRQHAIRLSLGVLANLHRAGVLTWIRRAVWERLQSKAAMPSHTTRPAAELLVVAVTPEAKGSGLARRLVEHMERQFRSWGFQGPYVILTLSTNARANAFYERIGATLVTQVETRGQLVNEYHKDLTSHG